MATDIRGDAGAVLRNISTESIQERMRRLASGKRINSAGDDAAGLAIALSLSAQERSYAVAGRNALDAMGSLQVADGGLGAQQDSLVRLRELAMQAGNGSLGPADRQAIQEEANGLMAEIERTGQETNFNGQNVLAADSSFEVQVGTGQDADSRIQTTIRASTAGSLGISGLDFSSGPAALGALDTIDAAMERVSANRAGIGASQSRLSTAVSTARTAFENLARSRSGIEDADIAAEASAMISEQIRQGASTSLLAQANTNRGMALRLLG